MTTLYLTGTRYPGAALKRFLPDYLDLLIERGEQIVTSNKKGVDDLVIRYCDQQQLPLQVCEFTCDSSQHWRNRRVKVKSDAVQVQRIVSPSWQRFRHLADKVDKMLFFHATTTRGKCYGLPTIEAFKLACQRRGVEGEQMIVQQQEKVWTVVQALRAAPIVGTTHLYVYARYAPGLDHTRHCVAHFRIETWRKLGLVIQPGIGRREIVIPQVSRAQATLQMLLAGLRELQSSPPGRLVIHYTLNDLDTLPFKLSPSTPYPELRQQLREVLQPIPKIIWRIQSLPELLTTIGKPISSAQELWEHRKPVKMYRGLYQ